MCFSHTVSISVTESWNFYKVAFCHCPSLGFSEILENCSCILAPVGDGASPGASSLVSLAGRYNNADQLCLNATNGRLGTLDVFRRHNHSYLISFSIFYILVSSENLTKYMRVLSSDDHQLLTFGDTRHGKLCSGEEESNVFVPQPADQLQQLHVTRVRTKTAARQQDENGNSCTSAG